MKIKFFSSSTFILAPSFTVSGKMEVDMDKFDIAKDKAAGKILETAGKITNDEELEFTGKFKAMTTKVKDRLYDVKEDVFQEGNRLLDKVNEKDRDKHDT